MSLSLPKVVLCLAAAAILKLGCTTDGGRADFAIEAGPGVSEKVAARAVEVSLSDARFAKGGFLSDPVSAEVRPDQRGLGLIVDVVLGTTRMLATLPLKEICTEGGAEGPIFGVRWLLDAEGREILAVSPVWAGDVSCVG